MPIPAILDDLDDVDESLHEHYKQTEDGRWALDLGESLREHPDAHGLKAALEKEREDAKRYKKAAKQLENASGMSAAELEELMALKSRGEATATELEELRTALKERDRALVNLKTDHELGSIAAELAGGSRLFRLALREKLHTDPETGEVYVPDADGGRALDDRGDPVSIRDYAARLIEEDRELQALVPSKRKAGGGTPPGSRVPLVGGGGGGTPPPAPGRQLTALERRNAEKRARIDRYKAERQATGG